MTVHDKGSTTMIITIFQQTRGDFILFDEKRMKMLSVNNAYHSNTRHSDPSSGLLGGVRPATGGRAPHTPHLRAF